MLQQRESWLFTFLEKLLAGDELAISLLDSDASRAIFTEQGTSRAKRTPKYAKVDMWHYEMNAPLWELAPKWLRGETVKWWRRDYEQPLIPEVLLHHGRLARANH